MSFYFLKNFLNLKGFSLIELLTSISILSALSVVGIKSYQSQVNKAKVAEAHESLSYVYTTQRVFYNNWNAYHANLMAVGAIPSGIYNYDVGFTKAGSDSDGDLGSYPSDMKKFLTVSECTSFGNICSGDCITKVKASITDKNYKTGYFEAVNCDMIGRRKISHADVGTTAEAKASSFKAIASEKLKDVDVWSINEKQELIHEKDGT